MHLYRITIVMPGGSRGHYTALFASGCEAIVQTLADFPEARLVGARHICAAPQGASTGEMA